MVAQIVSSRVFVIGLALALAATLFAGVGVSVQAQQDRREAPPKTAVLARSDNPVDALAAGAVAGQIGGIVLLTLPTRLIEDAQEGLEAFDPDLVVLAGGEVALSDQVRADVEALGYDVRRVSGANRFETAAELGALFSELGSAYLGLDEAAADSDQLEGRSVAELRDEFEAAYREVFQERLLRTTVVPNTGDPAADGVALREAVEDVDSDDGPHRILLDVGEYHLGDAPLTLPHGLVIEGAGITTTVSGNGSDDEAQAPTLAVDSQSIAILRQLRVHNEAHIDQVRRDYSTALSVSGGLTSVVFMEDAHVRAAGAAARVSGIRTDGQIRVERSELTAISSLSSATTAAVDAVRGSVIIHDSTLTGQNAGTNYGLRAERGDTGPFRLEIRRSAIRNTHDEGAAMHLADVDEVSVRDSELVNDHIVSDRRGTALFAVDATAEVHSSAVRGDTAFDRDPGGWAEFGTTLLEGQVVGSASCVYSYDENLAELSPKCD